MNRTTKIFYWSTVYSFIVITLFFPFSTNAQFDTRCFTKTQCIEAREAIGVQDPDTGFVQNQMSDTACSGFAQINGGSDVGFCSSAKNITTEITIGGKNTFTDLTEFIAYIFRFSFIVASTLATVVIIISGIQWMASGGNSNTISSAKSRIFSAISGLALLAFSYVILNTINPNLVNLQSLKVYLVNSIETTPKFCSELDTNTQIFEAGEEGSDNIRSFSDAVSNTTPIASSDGTCGTSYYIQNGGNQMCSGTKCPGSSTCMKLPNDTISECKDFNLVLISTTPSTENTVQNIVGSQFITNRLRTVAGFLPGDVLGDWNWPQITDAKLYRICEKNDDNIETRNGESASNTNEIEDDNYIFKSFDIELNNFLTSSCKNNETALGSILRVTMNDAGGLSNSLSSIGPAGAAVGAIGGLFNDQYHYIGVAVQNTNRVEGVDMGNKKIFENHIVNTEEAKKFFISDDQLRDGLIIQLNTANVLKIKQILNLGFTHTTDNEVLKEAYEYVGYSE